MSARTLSAHTDRPQEARRSRISIVLSFAAWDLRRTIRMFGATFFITVLPVMMYLLFGALAGYSDEPMGRGNGSAYVMASMAIYGAVTAMTSVAGSAAVERQEGWGRQLGLTGLDNGMYAAGKVLVGLGMSVLPVGCVFAVGAAMGARMDSVGLWAATAVMVLVGSLPFALYGLAAALLFRSESAVSVASGLLVFLAFFGNLFIPLSGTMLEIARFTPLYGSAALARWPQLEGSVIQLQESAPGDDALAGVLLSVVGWTLVFGLICVAAGRRRTAR